MDSEQVKELATAITNQAFADHWGYWFLVVALSFIGAAGGYFTSYFAKTGEFKAEQADRGAILNQLRENTKTTETIKSIISLGEWTERECRTLRRVKLEELIMVAHQATDWTIGERNVLVFGAKEQSAPSPLPRMMSICKLYFPELLPPATAYDDACRAYYRACLDVNVKVLAAKQACFSNGSFNTTDAENEVHKRLMPAVNDLYSPMHVSLMGLDNSASHLMTEIIAVPLEPSSA